MIEELSRVVISDEVTLLREGLAQLLCPAPLRLVATVRHPRELLTAVGRYEPDAAIFEVRLPRPDTASQPGSSRSGIAVVGLSVLSERARAMELLASDVATAAHLVVGPLEQIEDFLTALRTIDSRSLRSDRTPVTAADPGVARLSPRERDVMRLMAEGLGNSEIAERMFVTDGAVNKHIRSIFTKLDLAPTVRRDRRVVAVLRYLRAVGGQLTPSGTTV